MVNDFDRKMIVKKCAVDFFFSNPWGRQESTGPLGVKFGRIGMLISW